MFVGAVGGPAPDAHGSMGETDQPDRQEADPQNPGRLTYTFDREAPGEPGTYWVHVLVGRAEGCCRYQAYARIPVQVEVVLPEPGEEDKQGPTAEALRRMREEMEKREREQRIEAPPLEPPPPPPIPRIVIPKPPPRKARPAATPPPPERVAPAPATPAEAGTKSESETPPAETESKR